MAHETYLNPTLSIDSADTYVLRSAVLNAIKANLAGLSGTLLEIGCGQMPYRELILQNGRVQTYIGLDVRPVGSNGQATPDLLWDGTSIPLADASVDAALATELLERHPDPSTTLREIGRVLRPGGTLLFTTAGFNASVPQTLRRELARIDFDVDIAALGGWNASLAQMIGLWVNRSGLSAANRTKLFGQFEPFYKQLISTDAMGDQAMCPGFQGIAIKRAPGTARPVCQPIVQTQARATTAALPLISVCIPTYNRSAYIADCVKSVLDQADGRLEVLVIDDGSTDDTEAIVRGLGRPEIRYIRKPHTNGSDTRNVAVAEAAGEFILWVDSDDLLMPGAVKAHRRAMQKHPTGDVFYGNLKVFGDTRRFPAAEVVYEDYWDRGDYLLSLLVSHNRVPHGGTSVRRSLYERVGTYNPEFLRAHDYEFWCRAATAGTFKHVGGFTYLWRWHDTNMSSSSVEMDTAFEARALKELVGRRTIEELFPSADWTDRNSTLIFSYFQLAKAFIKWRDKDAALAWIERAVGVINPGWQMPQGTDDQQWKMVNVLVGETFADDPRTRAEFARNIDALRKRKASASAPAPAGFDRAFYEKKLTLLADRLKTQPGDIATTEQLKAELLHSTAPRVTPHQTPLVSVVIPYYQHTDTIAATLDSLGAQTYRHFEVLIVSDGDEAFPQDVLTGFCAQHPDIAVSLDVKPHSGLAATRNWAIERARGQYILPLDSDDLIAAIFLEKTVAVLESHPALSFVYTETLFFGEKNEIWAHVDFNPRLLLQQNLMTCTTLYRRDLWSALGGYNTNMEHGYEDWDFWIGAIEHGFRATNLHLPLFMYRRKKQSMLESRQQFDRLAKAQIVANHPTLYHSMADIDPHILDHAAVGRIPESLLKQAVRQVVS